MFVAKPKYTRIMLKLSGEALMGEGEYGINTDTLNRMADDVLEVQKLGVEVCMVVGGGEYLSRGIRRCQGHGACHSGLYGNAGNHHERAWLAKRF